MSDVNDNNCAVLASLRSRETTFSVEVCTSRTADEESRLWAALDLLGSLGTSFVSVTYGAGGSARHGTLPTVSRLQWLSPAESVAHLTAVGHSKNDLVAKIREFDAAGVRAILALRGDPPLGESTWQAHPEGLNYAEDLVRLTKEVTDLSVGVAAFPHGHPESESTEQDLHYLLRKLKAGADFAISQHFFDPMAFLHLRDAVQESGSDAVVVPGLIPITTPKLLRRAESLAGIEVMGDEAQRLWDVADKPEEFRRRGLDHTLRIAQVLLNEGVNHLHFYTLNRAPATAEIVTALGLVPER